MLSRVFTTREQLLLVGVAAMICVGGVTYAIAKGREREAAAREVVVVRTPAASPAPMEPAPSIPPLPVPVAVTVPDDAKADDSDPRPVRVSVGGAVAKPGEYEFTSEDRVSDALRAAGGALDSADLSDINRVALLIDGSTLTIPFAGVAGVEDGKRLVLRRGQDARALNPSEYTISGWRESQHKARAAESSPAARQETSAAKATGPLDLNTATAEDLETLPGVGPKLAAAIIEYRTRQPFQSVDELSNVSGIGDKKLEDIRPHVRVGLQ